MSFIFVLRAKSPCSGVCLLVLNLHRLDAWLLAVGLAAVQTPPGQPWPCPQGQGGKNGKVSIHCIGFKGLVTNSVYFPSKPPSSVEPNFSWWFSLCGVQRHSWYVPRISVWGSCFSLLARRRSSSSPAALCSSSSHTRDMTTSLSYTPDNARTTCPHRPLSVTTHLWRLTWGAFGVQQQRS